MNEQLSIFDLTMPYISVDKPIRLIELLTHQYAQLHFCNKEAIDGMIGLLQRMKELWEREEKQNG